MRQILLVLFFLLSFFKAKADLISLIRADQCESIIEMHVYEDHVRILMEIGKNDVHSFLPFLTPEKYDSFANTITERQLNYFLSNTLILEADGKIIKGELVRMHKAPRTYRSSLYTGKIDTLNTKISKEVILMELKYKINKPSTLRITPPIKENESTSMANIGFVSYHNNLPVNDLRYLSQKERLVLDWKDPWYSQFDNMNLRRHHKNSLMSFLYIEPFEVRHEVLVRIKDLDEWLSLNYKPGDKIRKDELDQVLKIVSDFLMEHNPVRIDGKIIAPQLDKARFVEVNLSGIQIIERAKDLDYTSAIIGVIFSYPTKTIAQNAEVHWDLWSTKIQKVPCLMIDPAGPMPYDITSSDPVLIWTNHLKNYRPPTIDTTPVQNRTFKIPYISIILILLFIWFLIQDKKRNKRRWFLYVSLVLVAMLTIVIHFDLDLGVKKQRNLSANAAEEIVASLLKNMYKSFDLKEQEQVYDKLTLSIEGGALSDIYLAHIQSMKIQQAGGAQASIESVKVDSVFVEPSIEGRIPIRTIWDVSGTVGHWGHLHTRQNRYDAIIEIESIDSFWKIVAMEVIEEQRVYPFSNQTN